jgi:hypothetical protein
MKHKMRDRVTEICEREFDHMARAAAAERQLFTKTVPHIGGPYLEEQHDELMRKISRALAAREWHARTGPSWARRLPLLEEECETLLFNEHNAIRLFGHFGRSLRWTDWDYERHPTFDTFCSGVLASPYCPIDLKLDPELRRMFPPKALAGISHPPLRWRPSV